MSDQDSYRVWNAATGKWARAVAQVDDKMYIQEETDDIHLAATWERDTAMSIVLDGLDRGQRLHEFAFDAVVPAGGKDKTTAAIPRFRIWNDRAAGWWRPKGEGYTGIMSEAALFTREEAQAIIDNAPGHGDRMYAAEADPPLPETQEHPVSVLKRIRDSVDELGRFAKAAVDALSARLEAHEVCIDGHRKSLCAIIERLEAIDKARTLERLVGAYPGRKEEKLVSVPDPRMQSPRDMCRQYSIQACHYCERLACGDNTSPGAGLYRAAKALIDQPGGARGTTVPNLIDAIKVVEAMG